MVMQGDTPSHTSDTDHVDCHELKRMTHSTSNVDEHIELLHARGFSSQGSNSSCVHHGEAMDSSEGAPFSDHPRHERVDEGHGGAPDDGITKGKRKSCWELVNLPNAKTA